MGRKPKLFQSKQSIKSAMERIGNTLVEKTLDAGMQAIKEQKPDNIKAKRMPKYLEVTEERMNKLGVIDLKPFFSKSSHKIRKKGGGWYIRVPIPRRKKNMSSRMYNQLRSINIAPDQQRTVISDYLYDRRRESSSSMLNYEPKSYNVNKQRTGKRKHTYVAYRTVSNESPPSSWILNRDKVNESDTSKTFIKNVERLMKWKMKNGWD